MVDKVFSHALQYGGYLLQAGLFCFLLCRGYWKRLAGLTAYAGVLLAVDTVTRPYALYRYGVTSRQYWYCFWLSDGLLLLVAFWLVCCFFRRACLHEQKMWRFARLLLAFVFLLVLGISAFSISRNYDHFFARFVVEFEQNLYFTCLVLNTLLYLLMQQLESLDDELGLLVCGMGIQFAGPAASFALAHLTLDQHFSASLVKMIMPMCTLGMLLTWFYAVARMPKAADRVAGEPKKKGLPAVEVAASKA